MPERGIKRSSIMKVKPEWIDYNGHLNMAYYNVLFDQSIDESFADVGLGSDYVEKSNCSFFTAEVHVCYLREIHEGDEVYVDLQLVDFDNKRIHVFQELYHSSEGFISATSEQLLLHVDMEKKKVSPWNEATLNQMKLWKVNQGDLPQNDRIGRAIKIKR